MAIGAAPKHERGQHRAAHHRHGHSKLLHRHPRSWWSPVTQPKRRAQIIVETASRTGRRRRLLRAPLRRSGPALRGLAAGPDSSSIRLHAVCSRRRSSSYACRSAGVELRRGGHKPPKDDQSSRVNGDLLDPIGHIDDPGPLIQERAALRPAKGWEGARSKIARRRAGGSVSESQAPTQSLCQTPTRPRLLNRADAMPDSPLDRGSLCIPAKPRQDQLVSAHDCCPRALPSQTRTRRPRRAHQKTITAPTNGCGVWMGAIHHAANPARNTPSPLAWSTIARCVASDVASRIASGRTSNPTPSTWCSMVPTRLPGAPNKSLASTADRPHRTTHLGPDGSGDRPAPRPSRPRRRMQPPHGRSSVRQGPPRHRQRGARLPHDRPARRNVQRVETASLAEPSGVSAVR